MIANRGMFKNILLLYLLANTLSCCTNVSPFPTQPTKPTITTTSANGVIPTNTNDIPDATSVKETPDDQQRVDSRFPLLFSFLYFDSDTILGPAEIYNLDLDGAIRGQLSRPADLSAHYVDPAWSPDCKKIAFAIDFGFGGEKSDELIGIMNLETGEEVEISSPFPFNYFPSWSNDGKQIAFTARDEGNSHIYILNMDTESITQLTFDGFNYNPDWSPINDKIIYVSEDKGATSIFIMNADGTGQREIIPSVWGSGSYNDPRMDRPNTPKWSPDGKLIAIKVREEALNRPANKIYLVDADGSNPRRLVEGDRSEDDPDGTDYFIQWEYDPVWSPDGTEILFVRSYLPTDEVELCFANVETGEVSCPGERYPAIGVEGLDWCHSDQGTLEN
jgi:Tol biopolymer transport system component